jgi:hypothetical protein
MGHNEFTANGEQCLNCLSQPRGQPHFASQVLLSLQMPLVDPTAKQSTFEKFYHYQPFNRDYLTATLCDQKLFFSHPHSVNDPWDCKPCFDHRPLLADPAKRKEMIMYLRSALPPEILNDPRRPILESLILSDDNARREAVERSSQILIEQIGMRRIYCLTPFRNRPTFRGK